MSMKTYYELKDMLCMELDKINKKADITPQSLDWIDKLTHSIKSLETIIAMNEAHDDESEFYPTMRNRSYEYRNGQSGARRRDRMGRYSRDGARDDMIEDLHEIMRGTTDEHMKGKIRQFISEIENS